MKTFTFKLPTNTRLEQDRIYLPKRYSGSSLALVRIELVPSSRADDFAEPSMSRAQENSLERIRNSQSISIAKDQLKRLIKSGFPITGNHFSFFIDYYSKIDMNHSMAWEKAMALSHLKPTLNKKSVLMSLTNDKHINLAAAQSTPAGFIDVDIHGNGRTFWIISKGVEIYLDPQALAKKIKNHALYHPNMPVRLLSCRSGAKIDGQCLAEQVAILLQVEVIAPQGLLSYVLGDYPRLVSISDQNYQKLRNASRSLGEEAATRLYAEAIQWHSYKP